MQVDGRDYSVLAAAAGAGRAYVFDRGIRPRGRVKLRRRRPLRVGLAKACGAPRVSGRQVKG